MHLDTKEEQEYKIALSEVDDILTFSDETIISKIPKSFIDFIRENKDKNHITNINPYLSLEEQDLNEKTKSIMAVIYRSYIATEEEKQAFLEKDKEEFEKLEALKNEKYDPNNIFKDNNIEKAELENKHEETSQEADITVIKEESFFRKLISKIKMFIKNIGK